MSRIWLEQLSQAVVIYLRSSQRPPDVPGHVIVAEAHGVRITQCAVSHLGCGPDPDPAYGAQPPVSPIDAQIYALLYPTGDPCSSNDRRSPRPVDPGSQPLTRESTPIRERWARPTAPARHPPQVRARQSGE